MKDRQEEERPAAVPEAVNKPEKSAPAGRGWNRCLDGTHVDGSGRQESKEANGSA